MKISFDETLRYRLEQTFGKSFLYLKVCNLKLAGGICMQIAEGTVDSKGEKLILKSMEQGG